MKREKKTTRPFPEVEVLFSVLLYPKKDKGGS